MPAPSSVERKGCASGISGAGDIDMMTGMVNDMGHRGRVVVEVGAPSQHILVIMPKGYERLGLVSVGSGDPGVLARITASGEYVQLDVGGTTPLDRRKVEAAIEAAAEEPRSVGRPRKSYERREVFSVSLEPGLAEYARSIGGGNLSEGVATTLREKRDATVSYVHSINDKPRIQFVPNAWRKSSTGDLVFEATVDGTPRQCFITYEALSDHFGASSRQEDDLKRAFVSGMQEIRAVAIRKLTLEAGDPILRTEDF